MSEPRDPSGPEETRGAQDPLRTLFQQAGDFGQGRAVADPAAHITERGMRAQRRRMAALAVGVCLVVGGGGAAAVGLHPVTPAPAPPATSPSPSYPSPSPPPPAGTLTEPPTPSMTVPGTQGSGPASYPLARTRLVRPCRGRADDGSTDGFVLGDVDAYGDAQLDARGDVDAVIAEGGARTAGGATRPRTHSLPPLPTPPRAPAAPPGDPGDPARPGRVRKVPECLRCPPACGRSGPYRTHPTRRADTGGRPGSPRPTARCSSSTC